MLLISLQEVIGSKNHRLANKLPVKPLVAIIFFATKVIS